MLLGPTVCFISFNHRPPKPSRLAEVASRPDSPVTLPATIPTPATLGTVRPGCECSRMKMLCMFVCVCIGAEPEPSSCTGASFSKGVGHNIGVGISKGKLIREVPVSWVWVLGQIEQARTRYNTRYFFSGKAKQQQETKVYHLSPKSCS